MQLKKKKKSTENGHVISKGSVCTGINYSNGPIGYFFNTRHLI